MVCPEKAYDAALDALREATSFTLEVAGNRTRWTTVKVLFSRSTMTFTTMVRIKPGDRFSKLVLGMHNFFNMIDTKNEDEKKIVLKAIENTEMFIGIIADPEFIDEEGHFAYLFTVARKLNALIFTGEAMQDANGRSLLGSDGSVG